MSVDAPDRTMTSATRSLQYRCWALVFHDASSEADETLLDRALPPRSDDFRTVFVDAFDPAVSPDACALWEGSYSAQDRSGLFEELARYYEHFGLKRAVDAELPDHLSVELEFMHFLTYLEDECDRNGRETADLLLAQRDFLARHLHRLASGMKNRCNSKDPRIRAMVKGLHQFLDADNRFISGALRMFG